MANNNFPREGQNIKDFYNSSVLKPNIVSELCNEITSNEIIDINVEKVSKSIKSI
jgi:hypothetical protein